MMEPQHMNVFFRGHILDVAAVIGSFWQNRESPENTELLCHLLSRYIAEKDVFDEIEFFIPQIAHMIIHFGHTNRKLWKLMIMICQASMHAALLLSFIFYAAMEDFQPEDSQGVENPHKDLTLHNHCAHVLASIEKVVLLGSPELTKLESNFSAKENNMLEFEELEAESRIRDSELIVEMEQKDNHESLLEGMLLYKRVEKKSVFVRKTWKPRHFKIENMVLNCFHDAQYEKLLRAIPLQDCRVMEVHNPHHENCFEIHSPITFSVFKLRAESRADMMKWIEGLSRIANGLPQVSGIAMSQLSKENVKHGGIEYEVTTHQKNRFAFFLEQRRFVESLTGICEELRFIDPSLHQEELKARVRVLQPPRHCYLNLSRSTDTWCNVLSTLPEESHAFKTKARVPTLLLFEMQEHLDGHDVATFLNNEVGYIMSSPEDPSLQAPTKFQTVFRESSTTALKERRRSMWSTTPSSIRKLSITSHDDDVDSIVSGDRDKLVSVHFKSEQDENSEKAGESFQQKVARIRKVSPHSHLPGWKIDGLICKSNDDLRQEVFVMQMIQYFIRIFRRENIPVWLLSYTIMSTSQTTGLIELIPNSQSFDALKKSDYWPGSLRGYFEKTYGNAEGRPFREAVDNFISSMAGYSVACYIIGIKDRHNGNIMLDNKGRVIHIDYGFVFGIAPGKQFSMETAPWKLTEEMVDVMGGLKSPGYEKFVKLTTDALRAVRKYTNEFLSLMEILTYKSNFPAFTYNPNAIIDLRDRMMPALPDKDLPAKVRDMMKKSYNHAGAIRYDKFQVLTNGIAR